MTTRPTPSHDGETLTLLDADGNITTDQRRAVSGELVTTNPDGSKTSTIFELGGGDAQVTAP